MTAAVVAAAVVSAMPVVAARMSVVTDPFAGEEVFDVEEVVRAACNVQQRGHRGHFFDLFLEEPEHELLAQRVVFRPGSGEKFLDVLSDLLFLRDLLAEAVRTAHQVKPSGQMGAQATYAWVAAEAGTVTRLRRYLVNQVGLDPKESEFRAYWSLGKAGSGANGTPIRQVPRPRQISTTTSE